MNQDKNEKPPIKLILLLFFSSGALALVYQLVWSRMMMHLFGSTALAVGTVLAAFMTGMALGAWLIGKVADRSQNCLRLYAWLELGIAVTALVTHLLLNRFAPAHLAVFELLGASPALFGIVRFLAAFVLVMVPTVLMGATLPVLSRFLTRYHTLVGVNLSTLYACNTFGAVTGVLITGYYLIGKYGIDQPVYMAVFGNLLIGGIAWMASMLRSFGGESQPGAEHLGTGTAEPGTLASPATVRLIVAGLGISGLASFAYEIYWTRSLVFIIGNSTYALTTMLSAFLTGIALGGFLARYLIRRFRDHAAVFGWVQIMLGIFSALALPVLFAVSDPQSLATSFLQASGRAGSFLTVGFGLAFLLMLLPATLIGTTFPLAGQIGVKDPDRTGSSVGGIYAVNTIGNVLGALLPGLVLLNWLGIQKGILLMAVLNTLLGICILVVRLFQSGRSPAWRFALPLAVLAAAVSMSRAPLEFEFPSEGERSYFQTLYYREGPLATTKVYMDGATGEKHMSVDGIVIGGTGNAEFKQLLLAHLPKLLIRDVSHELSVGVGSGILAGESALHPHVVRITGVEIEPSVIEGARLFTTENHGVLDDPRLDIVADDIGNFLRTTDGQYQVISADEKTADEYASNGFSYSRDYYTLLREHLSPSGLVAQWVPTTLPSRQFRMVLNTFSRSFEHVQLWYFLPAHKRGPFNAILIGSRQAIAIDPAHIDRQFSDHPVVHQSLAPYGLTSAESLLPHFVASENMIRNAVSTAPTNSLKRPRYEFYYPWEYARAKESQFIENHELIHSIWQDALPEKLEYFESLVQDPDRLKITFEAEDRYLAGFQRFLAGITLAGQFRLFDDALAMAPWNDSLRARIYAQYSYLASSQMNPAERARLKQKADSLYEK